MARFIRSASLANLNAVLEFFFQGLRDEGWSEIVLNASTTQPGSAQLGKESIFEAPGEAAGSGNARGHFIGFARENSLDIAARNVGFLLYAGMGKSAVFDISSASGSGTALDITTTATHPFQDTAVDGGDMVIWNGISNAALNQGVGGTPSAPSRVQAVGGATQFDAVMGTSVGVGPVTGTGGKCLALYNWVGSRHNDTDNHESCVALSTDEPMDAFAFVDKQGIMGWIQKGGLYYGFAVGATGRGHVQAQGSTIAKLSAEAVGLGAGTAVTLSLDRAPAAVFAEDLPTNSYMRVCLYPPDSAGAQMSGVVDRSQNGSPYPKVVAVGPGNQIQVEELPAFTYPIGTVVGDDCADLVCMGYGRTGNGNTNLGARDWYSTEMPDEAAESQAWPISPVNTLWDFEGLLGALAVTNLDPTRANRFHEVPHRLERAGDGWRYPVIGMLGWPVGSTNDLDFMRTGDPANAPDVDFLMLVNILADIAGTAVGLGPKATT